MSEGEIAVELSIWFKFFFFFKYRTGVIATPFPPFMHAESDRRTERM